MKIFKSGKKYEPNEWQQEEAGEPLKGMLTQISRNKQNNQMIVLLVLTMKNPKMQPDHLTVPLRHIGSGLGATMRSRSIWLQSFKVCGSQGSRTRWSWLYLKRRWPIKRNSRGDMPSGCSIRPNIRASKHLKRGRKPTSHTRETGLTGKHQAEMTSSVIEI